MIPTDSSPPAGTDICCCSEGDTGQNRVVKVIDERSAEIKAFIKRHLD